jgi:hypothetical protein
VAHEFCQRVDLVAAGRFPLLPWTVLAAGERAWAMKVFGGRTLRVSFASLRRGGISQSSPELRASCHRRGRSPAPGPLRIPVEVRCRSQRHVPGNGWDLLQEGAADG